jgi:hypothetical protein
MDKGRPPVAAAWTGTTMLTVKPSKTPTYTRWATMAGNAYARSRAVNKYSLDTICQPAYAFAKRIAPQGRPCFALAK